MITISSNEGNNMTNKPKEYPQPMSSRNPTSRHLTPESGHKSDCVPFNDLHGRHAPAIRYGEHDENPSVPERTGQCLPLDQLIR
jgi:hypothetical protein